MSKFSVEFTYHERLPEGNYQTDKVETFTKNTKDVSTDAVAALILTQLARRDIWVTGVRIWEFSKREISYKETNNGIVLKNKKYKLDGSKISCDDIEEETQLKADTISPSPKPFKAPPKPKSTTTGRFEYFNAQFTDPTTGGFVSDQEVTQQFLEQGKVLTIGKSYEIIEELYLSEGCLYIIEDDSGKRTSVNSMHFESKPMLVQKFDGNPYDMASQPILRR